MVLADTAFFIDLLVEEDEAVAKLDQLIEIGEPIWIPSIALHELYYGAHLHAEAERERDRIRELERAIPPVPFDAEAARAAGRIEATEEQAGRAPGRADVQIAATALSRGEPVLTRDAWFETVDGLRVETY